MQEYKHLLIAHIPGLLRYSLALIGNIHGAERLVSETLIVALDKMQQWDRNKNIKIWLYKLMRNLLDDLNKSDSFPQTKKSSADEILGLIKPMPVDPVTAYKILGTLNQLSRDHKEVLLLVILEGLEYREVSEITDLPLAKVMLLLHSSRKQMLAHMNPVQRKKVAKAK